MKNSDHNQSQLLKTEVNEPSSVKSKFNAESSMDINNPHLMGTGLNAKLGQSMCVQASKGFPSTDKFDLSQKGSTIFLKDLLRASNSYY